MVPTRCHAELDYFSWNPGEIKALRTINEAHVLREIQLIGTETAKMCQCLALQNSYLSFLMEQTPKRRDIQPIHRGAKLAIKDSGSAIKKTSKSASVEIGIRYFDLARKAYVITHETDKGRSYLKKSQDAFEKYVDVRSYNRDLDYKNWYALVILHMFQVKLHENGMNILSQEDKITEIRKGILCANRALDIAERSEALFRKFILLQMLSELDIQPPENPTGSLLRYLSVHSDKSSDEYLMAAHVYGSELAKQDNLEQAKQWFLEMLEKKEHPITYLFLGKVEDHLSNYGPALEYFEKAALQDPNNLEIQLWLRSQKVKNTIQELRVSKKFPEENRLEGIVSVFNEFYGIFSTCRDRLYEPTSTFAPLRELAENFYLTIIPEIAGILIHLQQFRFSLYLYQKILDFFDQFVEAGIFKPEDKIRLLNTMGVICFLQKDMEGAETYFKQALTLDQKCLKAYANLTAVYSQERNEEKIEALWKELELVIPHIDQDQNEELSALLLNFGTAYAVLGKEKFEKAEGFYRRSLASNRCNWNARIYLSRILTAQGVYSEAHEILKTCLEPSQTQDVPFGHSSFKDFQIYFCLSGITALLGQLDKAESLAIEAGKTHVSSTQTTHLQRYLKALKNPLCDLEGIKEEIKNSILKMGFECCVGRLLNKRKVKIEVGRLIGYHGTLSSHVQGFLSRGVLQKRSDIRQFKGEGFYIAHDKDVAAYFAMKKAKEQEDPSLKPVIIEVYAHSELVGKEVQIKDKPTKVMKKEFDFLQAPIDGFESYHQYYVFERSLKRLTIGKTTEAVEWTDEEYEAFQRRNTGWNMC